MVEKPSQADRRAPIFLLADDDREATQRILERLTDEWFYVPVSSPRQVVRYARQFDTTAVFLSDGVNYPRGGTARLLQEILDEVDRPVVILTEEWNRDVAAQWKDMGAADCLPHPTRTARRIESLRAKMQELAHPAPPPRRNR